MGAAAHAQEYKAQQAGRVYRVGILRATAPLPMDQGTDPTLRNALRELGYVEGQNLTVEGRYADGKLDRLPVLARELVQLRVDVIVAIGSAAIRAAKEATTTIPIVMYGGFDPVAAGFVASLARPGGNVTGVVMGPGSSLTGKRLELLREAVPGLSRVALLWNPDIRGAVLDYKETETAARSQHLELQSVEVSRSEDLDRAFSAMTNQRAQAFILPPNPVAITNQGQVASFARKHRLPSMYAQREYVHAGGLMSYGPSTVEMNRRAATYVYKILKGAKPADLPVEQPTKFELVVNLKTAKVLGLTIPQALIQRADEVIQ